MGNRMNNFWFLFLLAVCCAGCATQNPGNQQSPPATTANSPAPKARPIPCVEGNFQFVPGTWAIYDIHQLAENKKSRMYFALDQRVKKGTTPAMWIEVEVTQSGEPAVVTRFLAEETADGVGKLLDAIVQVQGYEPFRVPRGYLNENKDESPKLQKIALPSGKASSSTTSAVAAPPKKPLVVKGRTLHVYEVDGKDDQDRPLRAVVTEEVPPLALVSATTHDVKITVIAFAGEWEKLCK